MNKALEQYQEAEHRGDVARMIGLQSAIKFNGGGGPGWKGMRGAGLKQSQRAVVAGRAAKQTALNPIGRGGSGQPGRPASAHTAGMSSWRLPACASCPCTLDRLTWGAPDAPCLLLHSASGHINHSMFWQMLCPPKVGLAGLWGQQQAAGTCATAPVLRRCRAWRMLALLTAPPRLALRSGVRGAQRRAGAGD